jgi:hypothetical protein
MNRAIDDAISIAKKACASSEKTTIDFQAFKQTFEALSYFISEYKSSPHQKGIDEETGTSSPREPMEIDGDKMLITCRCNLSTNAKEVFHPIFVLIIVSGYSISF